MLEYTWICLNKQDPEYASSPSVKILNMGKFYIWQGFQNASVPERSEYARICFDRVLDISRVLNMAGFECARVKEL